MQGPPFEEPLDDEERAPAARTDQTSGGEGAVPTEPLPEMPTTRGPALDDEEPEDRRPSEISGEP